MLPRPWTVKGAKGDWEMESFTRRMRRLENPVRLGRVGYDLIVPSDLQTPRRLF